MTGSGTAAASIGAPAGAGGEAGSPRPDPRPTQPPGGPSAIPWRHRLSTKLLAVTAVLTVVGVAFFAFTERRIQEALVEQMESGAALFSQTVQRATLRAMLEDRRDDAYDVMRSIAAQQGVERVRVFNKEGRVTFSTNANEVGALVDKGAEACFLCHAQGQPLSHVPAGSRARIFKVDGQRHMGMVTPIHNEPRCTTSGCHHHGRGEQVLGVLDVTVTLEEVDRRIGSFRAASLVGTALAVLLLGGFFLLLARRHVVRPVAALLEGTRRVAVDDLGMEVHVASRGELGLLAASFNDMTRALRGAQRDLVELNRGLERRVEERTADLKAAQAALVQSEKLSSLGRLSASIAHEINNPLAGILTFSKVITRELEQAVPDEARRKALARNLALVQRETERCTAIVRNLLEFARERPLELKDVDLGAVVREGLELIAHQVAIQGHALERDLRPVPPVRADFGQLRQSIVNVALNACEAMQKPGRISVAVRPGQGGRTVEVAIADTGPGIPPEHLPHIFDPFYSTKQKGTGLGLSVVYGIIQRHGGTVEVRSEPGQGTCFTIRLPAAG